VTSPDYIIFSFYEDNEYGFICASLIPNLKALGLIYRDSALVEKVRANGLKYEAVTNVPGLFGTDWIVKAPQEIIKRGGAMSTSSCTTNGNIVGDIIMFLALHSYFDFFADTTKDYYMCTDTGKRNKIEEKIEKKFSEFKGYLKGILSSRARMIKTIFNFYYDQISFINTDMQHGLTRSESPEVLDYLRETSSGSQTEVPKVLSLPSREQEYFKGLKALLEDQLAVEKHEQEKAGLAEQLKNIESSIKTIDNSINIVAILEHVEGN
jgi:hypothetical protein